MATGVLTQIIDIIRVRTETIISQAMFSAPATGNNRLVETTIVPAWAEVLEKLTGNDRDVVVNFNIALVSGTRRYAVPPHMGTYLDFVKLNSENGVEKALVPRNHRAPGGWVWRIEHNELVLSFDPDVFDGETWTLRYVPAPDLIPHEGTAGAATSTTITLAATPTIGTLDTRPNAYLGAMVRILSDSNNILQERIITSYDVATRVATVGTAFSPTPSGTILYDILPPLYTRSVVQAVALVAARTLMTAGGTADKYRRLAMEAEQAIQTAQTTVRQLNGVSVRKMQEPTYDAETHWNLDGLPGHY